MRRRVPTMHAAARGIGIAVGLVVAVAMVAACTDDSRLGAGSRGPSTTGPARRGAASGTRLAGTSWALASSVDGATVPTLDFAASGSLSGSTGCNRILGTYTEQGSSLTVSLGPMTQMACASAAATQQEQRIVSALPQVRSSTRSGDTLSLQDSTGKELLSYTAVSGELAGTSWKVTGVNNGKEAVVSSSLTEKLTLEFGSDGTVSGNGGCNTFRGSYTQDGDEVTISSLASTMRGCEQDVVDLEAQYLKALESTATATRSGDSLELRDDSGALQVHATSAG